MHGKLNISLRCDRPESVPEQTRSKSEVYGVGTEEDYTPAKKRPKNLLNHQIIFNQYTEVGWRDCFTNVTVMYRDLLIATLCGRELNYEQKKIW